MPPHGSYTARSSVRMNGALTPSCKWRSHAFVGPAAPHATAFACNTNGLPVEASPAALAAPRCNPVHDIGAAACHAPGACIDCTARTGLIGTGIGCGGNNTPGSGCRGAERPPTAAGPVGNGPNGAAAAAVGGGRCGIQAGGGGGAGPVAAAENSGGACRGCDWDLPIGRLLS